MARKMSIKNFKKKYSSSKKKAIDTIAQKWKKEKLADDFLGTEIMTGVLVSEFIVEGTHLSHVKLDPEVKEAFSELMSGKVDSYTELRGLVVDKFDKGEKSVEGLINKIQGQYGENVFIENVGDGAELATSGNQEGWDVKIPREGFDEHIQVKVYKDADGVIEKMKEVNEKVLGGKDEFENIDQINFAVNSDIYKSVKEAAEASGLGK